MPTPKRLTYEGALERLLGLVDYERIRNHPPAPPRPDLQRVVALLEKLGNPHRQVPLVHIAGTKGKGSTAALLTSAFLGLGHPSGLFSSPHLHTFRERIRLNGEPVSEAAFAAQVEGCWPAVEAVNAMGSHGNVTLFELLGAMAFSAFVQEGCHWGVVEVGLGGRLDSTNVVDPAVAVITPISIDHAAILGGTIAEIAREKAGIIKPGTPVVSGPQPPEALEVIRQVSQEVGSPLTYVPEHYSWERTSSDMDGQAFSVTGSSGTRSLWIPLLGFHQIENTAVALAVLELLEKRSSNMASAAGKISLASYELARGFGKVQWPARMEVLAKSPVLMADGAHNAASLRRLHESLREYIPFEDLILVVGWGTDKESEDMVQVVAEMAPKSVVVGKSRHPRSMATDSLAELLRRSGVPVTDQCSSIADAVRKALSLVGHNDLVLATGSLFVAAETREEVLGIPSEVYPEFNAAAAPAI